MKFGKLCSLIFLTIVLSLSVYAQKENETVDLSGTWLLKKEESYFTKLRDIDKEEKSSYEDYTLEISQKEPEVKIVKSFLFKGKESKYELTLLTNKQGEQNIDCYRRFMDADDDSVIVWLEKSNFKSETFWKKGKLLRSSSFTGNTGRPSFITKSAYLTKETYYLSSDKKNLVVEGEVKVLSSGNIPTFTFRLIFQKKEK